MFTDRQKFQQFSNYVIHAQFFFNQVRTMSESALANRVKAIERAAGQHAVVKMRLFARVLCLEGLDDLAHDASEALQV